MNLRTLLRKVKRGASKVTFVNALSRKKWKPKVKNIDSYMQNAANSMVASSPIHQGSLKRVSDYAGKYVHFMGGGPGLEAKARISCLTHDKIRSKKNKKILSVETGAKMLLDLMKKENEKIIGQKVKIPSKEQLERILEKHSKRLDSDVLTAVFMREFLIKKYGRRPKHHIARAIETHGSYPLIKYIGRDIVRDGLIYSDKLFEANGAYIAFRRSMFMGERIDKRKQAKEMGLDLTKPQDIKKAAITFTLDETKNRLAKFSDISKIPKFMHPFVEYQIEWQKKLQKGLERNEPWAVNLSTELFSLGLKENPPTLDVAIKNYSPIAKEDKAFHDEALRYLNGELWKEFEHRVRL